MDDTNRIYRYLHDLMDDSERLQFEKELETNTHLRDTLKMEESIVKGIEFYGKREFKQRVAQIMANQKRRKRLERAVMIGIIGLILVLLGYFWFAGKVDSEPRLKNTNELMAAYLESPELGSGLRSEEGADVPFETTVRNAYRNNQYAQIAALPLDSIDIEGKWDVVLMLGVATLHEGQYQRAFDLLSQVPESAVGYYDHAEWYAILALIGLEERGEALERLGGILGTPDHDHYQDAAQLHNDIR